MINIIGLSIGLSSAFVIGAMIYYDMTFDNFHPDGERIYRVVADTKSPVVYYFMDRWLQGFTYRIDLSLWMFVIGGAATFLIAMLTCSFQSIRAAMENPINA